MAEQQEPEQQSLASLLSSVIKEVHDYPKPGIVFRDITSLLENPEAFSKVVDAFHEYYKDEKITKIIGTESRGFMFSAPLSYVMKIPFIPVRKPKKLPRETISESYVLEYGTDALEIHTDAVVPGDRVLLIDDLLATGGTLAATAKLVERLGGTVIGAAVVINLADLGGEQRLKDSGIPVMSLLDL